MSGRAPMAVAATGLVFPESPRWRDQTLTFSDIYAGVVRELHPDGSIRTVCEVPGLPSGLGWTPDGDLLVSSLLGRKLLRVTAEGLETVADLGAASVGPTNDMAVDARGRAYVGDVGFEFGKEPIRPSTLLLATPDGEVRREGDGLLMPNGIVVTPDGSTLLVAETFGGRVTAFDIDADGSLSGRRTWAELGPREFDDVAEGEASGQCLPDGIALDQEGALWVADSGGGAVQRVAAGGEILDAIDPGELTVYAVALGGEDGRTLYLCAAPPFSAGPPAEIKGGRILTCRVDVPGV